MPAMRCSMCAVNYPLSIDTCPECGEPTWRLNNDEPDEAFDAVPTEGDPKFRISIPDALPVFEKMVAKWPDARRGHPIPPSFEQYAEACKRFYDNGFYEMTYRDVAVALLNNRWPRG
jgi:hypothetical protein